MRRISYFIVFSIITLMSHCIFAATSDSPVGYWKTIDDKTGKPKSVVQITQSTDQLLQGKIVKLFEGTIKVCEKCDGPLKNKPIEGMEILGGLRPSEDDTNYWVSGQILDPKNGKTYKCNIQLIENGQKIQLRGYIGLPMFGRTQTWVRVKGPNAQ